MNRRDAIKITGKASLGVMIIGSPLALVGCGSTKQLAKYTGLVLGFLRDAAPILQTIPGAGNVLALIARAEPIAERLKKAFEDNDDSSALALFNDLTDPTNGIFVQIADAIGLITDDKRLLVLGLLALAQTALRFIAANIEDEAPADAVARTARANPDAVNAAKRAASREQLENAFKATRF